MLKHTAAGLNGAAVSPTTERSVPMARLNTTVLVLQATDVGFRLNQVQSDPAVRKAGSEALADTSQALTSIGRFGSEIRDAWYRSQPSGGVVARPG